MPPKPRKKAEKKSPPLDASSRYAKFPVWKINELLRFLDPSIKGLTTMNKGYKIKILSTLIRDKTIDDTTDPVFQYVRPTFERDYGLRGSTVRAYNETEQEKFMAHEHDDDTLHPLRQKKLDAIKHKIPYNKKLVIGLQKHQQEFVVSFLNDHLQGALLFHSVGSGKTLTAAVFSHYYLALKPTHNVTIISPPSLLFNFVEALKQYGLDIKDNRYKFETYEKFCKNPDKYVNDKTLLIIDEAHNFRTFINSDATTNKRGHIIQRYCMMCDKVLAMTGTPFVNGPYDIENIMTMISKRGSSPLVLKSL